MDGLVSSSIDEEDNSLMETEFEKDKVVQALKELRGDKAPLPNGFTVTFFQHCWQVVECHVNVMAFLKEFYDNCKFEKSLDASFIALIPKKANTINIRDLRPISLVGSICKILANLLLNKLVSGSLYTFVGWR